MKVCMADVDADELKSARADVAALAPGGQSILAMRTDVAEASDLDALRDAAYARFGEVHL
jgi:hypothetical protein